MTGGDLSPSPPNSRPRVVIITRSIDRSGTSGSGHHLREMIRHLVPLAPDLEIVLAHYDADADDEVYGIAPSIVLPFNPFRASRALDAAGSNVVHFSPLTIVAPIHGLRAKKVATIHSAEPMLLPDQYSLLKRLHSRFVIPRYARKLDALVTVSETSKRFFADHYRIPPERIAVTYNACAPAYRRLGPEEYTPGGAGGALRGRDRPAQADADRGRTIPGAPGWPYPARYILHVSRYSERKNPWTMIEAFGKLVEKEGAGTTAAGAADDRQPLHLVLAGKGWDAPEVRERAEKAGVGDRVITPGFVAEATVVELLNRAELFWFPSLSEGFGMPNVEAMACGCPVVTSAVFAIPEIVGDAAVVVDDPLDAARLAEASAALLDGDSPAQTKRDELVRRGSARADYFSWDTSAAILANVYRRLLGMPVRGPERY